MPSRHPVAQLPEGSAVLTLDGPRRGPAAVSDPDVALMLAFAAGREDAFVELYRRYRDRIVGFTRRMLRDQAQAEEAAQDVFLKLYRARASYQPTSRFSTFIYRIATNHCLNLHARLDHKLVQRDDTSEDHRAPQASDPLHALVQRQLRAALEKALAKLPERQRAALLLVHYEGQSYREAAESIDVSEAALKSLIHRARATMAAELEALAGQNKEIEHAV
jgi:RNA polymerase sigma-70 factor (ECF subfamily)